MDTRFNNRFGNIVPPEQNVLVPSPADHAVSESTRDWHKQLTETAGVDSPDLLAPSVPTAPENETDKINRLRASLQQPAPAAPFEQYAPSYVEQGPPTVALGKPEESTLEGCSLAAMGTGSAATLGTYASGFALKNALLGGSLLSNGILGGIPLATGAVGAYIGKRTGHTAVGALTGAAAGAVLAPTVLSAAAGGGVSVGTAVLGAGSGLATLTGVAIPCAAGAGLYGLGRLTSHVMGLQKKGGVLKNMALGAVSPFAIGGMYAGKAFNKLFRKNAA